LHAGLAAPPADLFAVAAPRQIQSLILAQPSEETDIQKDAANAEGGAARHSAALSLGATHSEDVTWTSTRNLAPVSKLG
jgi:hypothetical protein